MNIEEVYGFIRSEDAVLWVGTGFSLYANYPSGKALADQINANLPDKEKETDPRLMEVAYKYELINGRKQLIEFLSQIIEATPFSDEKWHKELALIPHIKTIITTNYDNLFEKNYGDKCVVIRTDADIKNIDENKTAIFKIHGDFLVPDKLIITRDDYAKWLGEFPKTPLYNLVVSRLITKSVIFLGYSIEDINALTLINTINSQLGELLWVNIIMDGPPALTPGMEPIRDNLMDRRPTRRDAGIVSRGMLERIIVSGAFIAVVFMAQSWTNFMGGTAEQQSTILFTLFVVFQLFNAFNSRELGNASLFANLLRNKVMIGVFALMFALQVLVVQFGGAMFRTVPLPIDMWLKIIAVGFGVVVLQEVIKTVKRAAAAIRARRTANESDSQQPHQPIALDLVD